MPASNDPADAPPDAHVPTRGLYGHITHTDMTSTDPAATRAWAESVLGWTFRAPMQVPGGGEYHLFAYGETGGGGIGRPPGGESPGSIPFVHVASCQEAFDKAIAAGATVVSKPQAVMPGVTIACVMAPGGVKIGFSGP